MNEPERLSASIYIKRSEEKEQLQKLKEIETELYKYGIQFQVGYSRYQDSKNFVSCVVSVHFDRKKLSRGAGRPEIISGLTLAEVESLIAQYKYYKSPQEIAHMVGGYSVATFYRHMKKAMEQKENGVDPDYILF